MGRTKNGQRVHDLEEALIEYIQKYGPTKKARLAMSRKAKLDRSTSVRLVFLSKYFAVTR